MRSAYRSSDISPEAKELGYKILDVLLASGKTYEELEDALEAAQLALVSQTRPVSVGIPPQCDS